ncbi:hypothetical protein CIG75_05330 [Tumebacillus algifaecis]|uniref:Aminoglycoside phosphotransferase domain-containing protein n=1 Tax=Tumebacillus algifaecis TaxID=1214604 RepID=A0A223CYI2_9BACL|nr:CotS family spore coat protein [Tumebacillus algifaecis]ASS74469.1 hypothetical protein CIG75_05330 [Tumebacillus algifaecis]
MADKSTSNKGGDWLKQLFNEMMRPPKWMKDGKPGTKKPTGDGKKAEADVSPKPKKRQPPAWWSWSQSDGVPKSRQRNRERPIRSRQVKKNNSPVKKERTSKSQGRLSQSDLGSALPGSASDLHAQIRRHGFNPTVLKSYKITPTKVEPFGPVLRLRTNQGLVSLKKCDLRSAHVAFLHQALQHVEKQKFTRFAPFLLTSKGLPYAQIGGDTYYATRWLRGQEVDFRSMPQLALATRTLADFHKASRGFDPSGYAPPSIFDMVDRFNDRRDELVEWKRRASIKSRPDDIDKIFLKHADHYIAESDTALKALRRPQVRSHLLFEEDDPPLLHLDLTPYNMIYTPNNQVALIDFDFAAFGPRTLDLAHLMRRALQRHEWDEAVARHALVNYGAISPLTPAEYMILSGLLRFPHRFWRIGYQHYDIDHDPNHLGYFQLAEAEEPQRLRFLDDFEKQIARIRRT